MISHSSQRSHTPGNHAENAVVQLLVVEYREQQ